MSGAYGLLQITRASLRHVCAKLDLGLVDLRLVSAANALFQMSKEVVLLHELVGAILAPVRYEVCVMNLNMLLHVPALGERLTASGALQDLVHALSGLVPLPELAVSFLFLADRLAFLELPLSQGHIMLLNFIMNFLSENGVIE